MERWIVRRGTAKSGFRYVRPDGDIVRDAATLGRINRLRIPPAWRDVHIAVDARRAIQAYGYDARGRKQYRYHSRAVATRELRKYHRVRQLAKVLPRARQRLRAHSTRSTLACDTVCAMALRLISESLFRPGYERYERENGSYGITTMQKRHVRLERDRAVFTYKGKSRRRSRQLVANRELVRLLERLYRTPGRRLFRYRDGDEWRDLQAPALTAYMRTHVGPFAVKDFRTWGGTLRAATVLAELGPPSSATEARRNVALAMRVVSSELGNTPAVCRSAYVHPIVIARYTDESDTIRLRHGRRPWQRSRDSFAHSPEEAALIAFLDRHFPERRRRARDVAARAA